MAIDEIENSWRPLPRGSNAAFPAITRGPDGQPDRAGQPLPDYLRQLGDPLTPQDAGTALAELAGADPAGPAPAYLLTHAGLRELPA